MTACLKVMTPALLLALAAHAPLSAAAGFQYWNPQDTAAAPKTLSAMGLYKDITAKKQVLVPSAHAYEVNSPLWSDDAKKKRWVLLKPRTSIGFRELDDYWDYPDSAVFVKDFDIDTIPGDTTSRIHWETRVLVNTKEADDGMAGKVTDVWYGFSYKWDADQKEARLVGATGQDTAVRIWPQGPKGASRLKKWTFPSRNQCVHCHRTEEGDGVHGRTVLGFFTAQLNRPHPDSAGRNQLDALFAQGVLKGSRPAVWDNSPRWRGIEEDRAGLDVRARSYIAANCSGCHGDRGEKVGATFGVQLNYDFHTMEAKMDLRHRSVAWPFGLDDGSIPPRFYPKSDYINNPGAQDYLVIDPAVIVPGYPQKSVLLFRQTQRDTTPGDYDPDRNQMPPLASFEVNLAATDLIKRWILEMGPVVPVGVRRGIAVAAAAPAVCFQGRTLVVSREALKADPKVSMLALNGGEVRLERLAEGLYALPAGLPKGLYYIRAGGKSLLKYLL